MAKVREHIARIRRRPRVTRIGPRDITTRGLTPGIWTDFYHRALTAYWPVFFGTAALIFIVLNTIFAFLYWLGDNPIANVPSRHSFLDLFYFSIETLATVGYGDMHPRTDYGHLIATIEIFTGMSLLAVMTGLVFARFSRPRARFVFARHPVVATFRGEPTLMIRVANARHNTISQATAQLWLFRLEDTDDNQELRRFYELKLDRNEHPMFALSWTLLHVIDGTSVLAGMSPDDLTACDGALILNLSGIDDNSAQRLHARQIYTGRQIRWWHRYRDITSVSEGGRVTIDYTRFHDVYPEEEASPEAATDPQ